MILKRTCAVAAACIAAAAQPALSRDITDGVAITDSAAMEYLETHGFALNALLAPAWKLGEANKVLNNAELAKVAPISALRNVVRMEFREYQKSYLTRFPDVSPGNVGTGTGPEHRKFERNYLDSAAARFNLVGVVNRMDRRFRSPGTCGEIRFLFRLAYNVKAASVYLAENGQLKRGSKIETDSRLPFSINLVLRAKNLDGTTADDDKQCQDIAKRWISAGGLGLKGEALAKHLIGATGALALVHPDQIDRMETNLQIIRVPAGAKVRMGGNAEYLMNIFNWNPGTRTFNMKRLENQIDRIELLKNPGKLRAFRNWLFTPENLRALDDGTIAIPEEYLTFRAITSAPGGTARATNRPFLGLISDALAERKFDELKDAAARLNPDGQLRNIKSAAALQQRLTDITCTGCHQSRAIGGFHFMGADWKSSIRSFPQNAIFVAGSPHFYGDLPRRRAVVKAVADGKSPDFGRGFSMRPGKYASDGTTAVFPDEFDTVRNGWGANCYTRAKTDPGADKSFADWTCAKNLECMPLHESVYEPDLGICVNTAGKKDKLKIGDPFLIGKLTKTEIEINPGSNNGVVNYKDDYCAKIDFLNGRRADASTCLNPLPGAHSNDDTLHGYQKGGFFGGMKRFRGCAGATNTVCGREAGGTRVPGKKFRDNAFGDCVIMLGDEKTSFKSCLTGNKFTHRSTLRACNAVTPCRDDYLCLATDESLETGLGACLPPYFLFQFRTDGHPAPPEGAAAPPECLLPEADLGGPRPDYCARFPRENG